LPAIGGWHFLVADVLHLRNLMPLTPSSTIISYSAWQALERVQSDEVQKHLTLSARRILARLRLEQRLVKARRRVRDKEGKQRTISTKRHKRFLCVLADSEENKTNDRSKRSKQEPRRKR